MDEYYRIDDRPAVFIWSPRNIRNDVGGSTQATELYALIQIVDTGWASEPWHGCEARLISGRTPKLFGQLCKLAAEYAKQNGKKIVAVGPCSEWGEGSYIEPYAEYGFTDLDELRQAFCKPADWAPNLIPANVGRGPYDLAMAPQKTAWTFDKAGDNEGWTNNSTLKVHVADGLLQGESAGHDPILGGPGVLLEARQFGSLVVRMRASADDAAQLFWGTALSKQSELNSVRFQLTGDGEFHEYRIDLAPFEK